MLGLIVEKGVTAIIGRDYCGDIIGIYKHKGITTYNVRGKRSRGGREGGGGQSASGITGRCAL